MGTDLTLLFTDVEGSTAVNARLGDAAMSTLWRLHDRGSRDLLHTWHGREVDRSDGLLALFDNPQDAASFATAYHRLLASLPEPLLARAGLHTGPLDVRQNAPADVALGAKPVEAFGIGKAVGARLMALARGGQTLASAAAAAQLQAAGWRTACYGHWRMKGLPEPLEVHEVGDDSAPWLPPPDAEKSHRVVWHRGQWMGGHQVPHNLPAERDRFVGRSADLRALAGLLDPQGPHLDSPARLVTLHGTGGMGKTRLALRHAWAWRGNFPGGVWFCDLAQARSLDSLLQAVAVALDVPLGADPVAQLGRAIANRERCLLIFDNFEQVTRHAAATVGRWLDMAPQARFVATSREVLGLRGEHTLALDALAPAEAAELFHERALAALSSYQRSAADDRAVAQLVHLLDGLPLAIELAAPRVRVMAPAQLLARMGDRFRLLAVQGSQSGRPTGRNDRQATLQNALQWSWELMSEAERHTLAQLAVFEGGFDLPAAEAVVDLSTLPEAPWLVDLLQGLGDKSLLRRLPGTRFGLLRAVQAFALTHLPPEALAAARARHGRYYAALGERSAGAPGGLELDNLVQACRHAVGAGDASAAASCLGLAWIALRLTGPLRAAADLAQELRAGLALSPRDAAIVGWVEGGALVGSGRAAEGHAAFVAALAAHPAPDEDLVGGRLHAALGERASAAGDMDSAFEHLQTALQTGLRLQDAGLQCLALNELAALALNGGEHAAAQAHFTRALRIATEAEDRRWQGGLLGNLGALHYTMGHLAEARAAYEQALQCARDAGDRRWEANHRANLGLVYLGLQETALAEQAVRDSLTLSRDIGHARLVPPALCNLGHVLAAAGKVHEARSVLLEAQALGREAQDLPLVQECQTALDALPPEAVTKATAVQLTRD